jgi:hypothetical protein
MELTMRERKKLTMVKAQAYLRAGKTKKSAMLDDFCESTGYHRKYAARVLHQAGQRYLLGDCILVADPARHIHRYRPPRYGPAALQALITIWSASTFLGPVRLAGGMSLFVENLTMHGHLSIDEETRRFLFQMSPATIGRLLAGECKRYVLHGISRTRSTPLGGRIPIQTCMNPHPRALLSKARGVVRSRPYHKNDNAHVEEKNDSVKGKFVGYDRHDSQTEIDLLKRLYRSLHLLVNWFLPSQKLLSKVRTGSHITKVYDQAQTPCVRMLMDVPEETKRRLRATRAELDLASLEAPLGLNQHPRGRHEILHYQEQLDEMAKRRQPLVIKKRGNYAYLLDESTT